MKETNRRLNGTNSCSLSHTRAIFAHFFPCCGDVNEREVYSLRLGCWKMTFDVSKVFTGVLFLRSWLIDKFMSRLGVSVNFEGNSSQFWGYERKMVTWEFRDAVTEQKCIKILGVWGIRLLLGSNFSRYSDVKRQLSIVQPEFSRNALNLEIACIRKYYSK